MNALDLLLSFRRRACGSLLLVFALGTTFFGLPGAIQADLDDGLLGYWQFNGNGSDQSGNARDLTLNGAPGFSTGLFGQALSLNGNNAQYASRPVDDQVFDFGTSDFSVQTWINLNSGSISRHQDFVEKWGGSTGWVLTKLDAVEQVGEPFGREFRFHANGVTGPVLDSAPQNLTASVWHNVIVSRQGTSWTMWFDGSVAGTSTLTGAISDTANPLRIGARSQLIDPRDFSVNGKLDEIAIWNRALTNDEIAFLYNGGVGNPISVPEPSTLALAIAGALGLFGFRCRIVRARVVASI